MKKKLSAGKTLIAVGIASALMLAACSKSERPPGQMSDSAAAEAPKSSGSLGAAIDDTGITAQVKGKLASDTRTKDSDIGVETNNGVVMLTGAVADNGVKTAAEELARNVTDVKGVDNKIAAPSSAASLASGVEDAADRTGAAVSDGWISTKVKSSLVADDQIKGMQIDVTTHEGVVKLSGSVPSPALRDRAVEVTKKIEGVKGVDESSLTVASR